MEPWQISHIKSNLTTLIKFTNCNQIFLSILVEKGHLGDNELVDLNGLQNKRYEQALQLYEILKGRTNSYDDLRDAFQQTNQTGAYNILNQCNRRNINSAFRYLGQISYNKNDLIGRGCYNTKVFGGKFSGRDVAVKMITCHDEDDTEHVYREIKMMILIDAHPNIITYYHAEIGDDFVLIALERCTTTLHDLVELGASTFGINKLDASSILKQASLGVDHLHKHKVLHGDLKPPNMLLIISSNEAIVKLCDFGLARTLPTDRTSMTVRSSMGLGTEGWVAPEVLKGLSPRMSLACDVFSLGCIYYFVLSNGQHPFGDPIHRQANIVDGNHDMNDDFFSCYNVRLKQLVEKMVAKEPERRPKLDEILSLDFTKMENHQCSNINNASSENSDVQQSVVEHIEPLAEVDLPPVHYLAISEPTHVPPASECAPAFRSVNVMGLQLDIPVQPTVGEPATEKKKLNFGQKFARETKRIGKRFGL